MAGRAMIRASDADRERVAEHLRKAAGEGRLLTHELEARLETAFAARTYGQLDTVLSDLPAARRTPRQPGHRRAVVRPALAGGLVVLGLALAAIAAVLLLTGVFAGWILWTVVGWWLWGRHGRGRRGPWAPRRGHYYAQRRFDPGRGF